MNTDSLACIVGLGYVGLAVAVASSKVAPTIGYDINSARIDDLLAGIDRNGEATKAELLNPNLRCTSDEQILAEANIFVIAVPTPLTEGNQPDLQALIGASRLVGGVLRRGSSDTRPSIEGERPIVIFESTVYPGCTEEVCIPVLEEASGLRAGVGFGVGYSPERINPGDPAHGIESVVKVVSGQDDSTLDRVRKFYSRFVIAGVHAAPDIRTAEAAKIIENVQRDLNIGLMNELAKLFHTLDIDTGDVLAAARTKWNFLPFEPGLVGGHCIPVDPYYLTHKAQQVGFHPEIVLAGRRVNDGMADYIARETVEQLIAGDKPVAGARILILGASFKENVPDLRNSMVARLVAELVGHGAAPVVFDPVVGAEAIEALGVVAAPNPFAIQVGVPVDHQGGMSQPDSSDDRYEAVVLAVPHQQFLEPTMCQYTDLCSTPSIIVDVKGALGNLEPCTHGSFLYWRL